MKAATGPQRTAVREKQTERWIVTGASAGIGLAICRRLIAAGHDVIGCGRRSGDALPSDFPDIRYVSADIGTAAGRALLQAHVPDRIQFALLNAGIGHYRPLQSESGAEIVNVLSVNLLAPMAMAHALYPALEASRGVLGLVGSVAWRGAAGMPVYASSKAGLDGFGRSLRSEWHGRVDVRVIHPGPTATGMAERAGMTSRLAARLMLPVDDVAAGIIEAMYRTGRARRRISHRAVLGARLRAGLGMRVE
jgi:NAD(P)-dependent dehydrogenase (short-subunit alcohol dehydrogenase family)